MGYLTRIIQESRRRKNSKVFRSRSETAKEENVTNQFAGENDEIGDSDETTVFRSANIENGESKELLSPSPPIEEQSGGEMTVYRVRKDGGGALQESITSSKVAGYKDGNTKVNKPRSMCPKAGPLSQVKGQFSGIDSDPFSSVALSNKDETINTDSNLDSSVLKYTEHLSPSAINGRDHIAVSRGLRSSSSASDLHVTERVGRDGPSAPSGQSSSVKDSGAGTDGGRFEALDSFKSSISTLVMSTQDGEIETITAQETEFLGETGNISGISQNEGLDITVSDQLNTMNSPRVSIGQIDVIIVSQVEERSKPKRKDSLFDISSRNYTRRL